jgi:hypothetical protein
LVAVSLTIIASCDGPGDCTLIALPGLRVVVVSDVDGGPVSEGLRVVGRDGAYEEQLSGAPGSNSRWGAFERAGNYDLTVEATGFVTQTVENVRVREDGCHVIPKDLTVEMVPAVG